MPLEADNRHLDSQQRVDLRDQTYHSALDDNRHTTQQVVLPRRSGIHAVMQRGPRFALIAGAALALGLFLRSVIGLADTAPDAQPNAARALPTLTPRMGVSFTTAVIVAGTGDAGLYLRAGAGRDAAILATIPEGERLGVTGAPIENEGTWLPVETSQGLTGWIAADYTREE